MKRFNITLEQIFSPTNLLKAFYAAKKSKRASAECRRFEMFLGYELAKLRQEVLSGRYTPQPYKEFIIYEPKKRTVSAPAFRDCVVQHALYAAIYPLIDRRLIAQSHGCRVGKGFHSSSDYALIALRASGANSYYLQLDVSKFFASLDHGILRKILAKYLKSSELLELLMRFIHPARGVPIGNLLSQLFGLIYLNPLDHFIKRRLKIKYYCRFVDDFVLFNLSKAQIAPLLARIKCFLHSLNLSLSRIKINKSAHGLNFTGYLCSVRGKSIRPLAYKRFKRALKRGDEAAARSYLALAKGTLSEKVLIKEWSKNDLLQLYPL